jgi:hypothetical protein
MQPEQYVERIAQAMDADGSSVSQVALPGGYAIVGYQSQFKFRWFATKVHLFTVAAPVPVAAIEGLEALTRDSIEYAKQTNGKLRGLQTGVAAIPILVSDHVTPEARAAVQLPPKKGFAAMTLPAIVDLTTGEVLSYRGTQFIGIVYASWLRERLAAACPPPR